MLSVNSLLGERGFRSLAERECLRTSQGAGSWLHILHETLDLEVIGCWLFVHVLSVDLGVHAQLCVCHPHVCVVVCMFFGGILALVSLLHIVASLVPKVVGDHSVDRGWGPIASAIGEGFRGQELSLLWQNAKWNSSVMGTPKVVLLVGSDSLVSHGHLVELLEVTGVLSRGRRVLVDSPVPHNMVGGLTVGQQIVLATIRSFCTGSDSILARVVMTLIALGDYKHHFE